MWRICKRKISLAALSWAKNEHACTPTHEHTNTCQHTHPSSLSLSRLHKCSVTHTHTTVRVRVQVGAFVLRKDQRRVLKRVRSCNFQRLGHQNVMLGCAKSCWNVSKCVWGWEWKKEIEIEWERERKRDSVIVWVFTRSIILHSLCEMTNSIYGVRGLWRLHPLSSKRRFGDFQ